MGPTALHYVRIATVATAIGLEGWLLVDFLAVDRRKSPRANFNTPALQYDARVRIAQPVFDTTTVSLKAPLEVEIAALAESAPNIEHLTLGVQQAVLGDVMLHQIGEKQGLVTGEVIERPGGPPLSAASAHFTVVLAADPPDRGEVWFPLDRYRINAAIGGCANPAVERQCNFRNIRVTGIDVRFPDPAFEWSAAVIGENTVSFTLRRRAFERKLSLVVLICVLAYFYFILWAPLPKAAIANDVHFGKALALIAGLLGLRAFLVPKSVTTFPTLVDYVGFGLTIAVFATVLGRYLKLAEQQSSDAAQGGA